MEEKAESGADFETNFHLKHKVTLKPCEACNVQSITTAMIKLKPSLDS